MTSSVGVRAVLRLRAQPFFGGRHPYVQVFESIVGMLKQPFKSLLLYVYIFDK